MTLMKYTILVCAHCGRKFQRLTHNVHFHRKSDTRFYCSKDCYSKGRKGSSNPAFIDGKAREPYGEKFYALRNRIRDRDKGCVLCHTQSDLGVHHIDYNKKNNGPDNLVTLCKACHAKTNQNRTYWRNYFAIQRGRIGRSQQDKEVPGQR